MEKLYMSTSLIFTHYKAITVVQWEYHVQHRVIYTNIQFFCFKSCEISHSEIHTHLKKKKNQIH